MLAEKAKYRRFVSVSYTHLDVYKRQELYFSIEIRCDYTQTAEIPWIVRKLDNEGKRVNDLGHTTVLRRDEERYEGCSYSGTHYMECRVLDHAKIQGISAVQVTIAGFSRPVRNPPRRKYFKGK